MSHYTSPVNLATHAPAIYQALGAAQGAVQAAGLDSRLHHLVVLRASQMNGCAFCVKMHTKDARQDHETDERLDRPIVLRHVDDFSDAEKAAFAWTEALTVLKEDTEYGPLRARLRKHYTEEEIAALTATVGMINVWNRLQVSQHE